MTWIAAALLCAGCAGGQDRPTRGLHAPGEGDVADGGVDRREARLGQFFISPSGKPFRGRPGEPYPVVAWFAEADSDADGRLTRAEFRADADAFFPIVDTNGDGVITMAEVSVYEHDIAPEITRLNGPRVADGGGGRGPGGSAGGGRRGSGGGHGGGGGGRGGRGGESEASSIPQSGAHMTRGDERQGAAMFSLINEAHPIRGADADLSMTVTRAEWRAAADRRFARLDVDGDGVVALGDLPQTPVQAMGARPGHRR